MKTKLAGYLVLEFVSIKWNSYYVPGKIYILGKRHRRLFISGRHTSHNKVDVVIKFQILCLKALLKERRGCIIHLPKQSVI